ncbi:MAG: cytochrome c peroxidase [Lautropia sp.]|nr:cytochrome c peroxidase [Lautropia sp.]
MNESFPQDAKVSAVFLKPDVPRRRFHRVRAGMAAPSAAATAAGPAAQACLSACLPIMPPTHTPTPEPAMQPPAPPVRASIPPAGHHTASRPAFARGLLTLMLCSALAACGGSGGGGGGGNGPSGGNTIPPSELPRPTAVTPTVSGVAQGPASAGQAAATRRPQESTPIAFDQQPTPRLWVVNPDQDSVSVLDGSSHALLKEIPVGTAPRTLAIDNAGHVWVSNRGSGTISIIDPASLEVVTTITLSSSAQPYGVVNAPDGSGVWVSLLGSEELLQFDPVTRAVKQRLWVGPEVRHVSVDGTGARLLASRFISPPLPGEDGLTVRTSGEGVRGGEVMVIDVASATISHTVGLAVSLQEDTALQGRGLPNYLGAAAISPDGKTAWVPSKQDNVLRGMMRDQRPLNFESTVRAIVSRIELAGTPTENVAGRFDLDNTSLASAATYTPDGRYVLVALETSRELAIMDAATGLEVHRMVVGNAPQGVAISADGRTVAVSNFMARSVSFVDMAPLLDQNSLGLLTPTRQVPTFTSPDKLAPQVLLGKQIFYDALNPLLARDRYMSCAACHNDGYGDGRVWDMSGFGEGLRKTISLRGHGGKKQRLHWSGNFDEVQDFEQQIRALAGGAGLMDPGEFLSGRRAAPLGSPKAGRSEDLDALAAYVNSLSTYAPSPFRPADRSFSAAAQGGEALFKTKDCQSCHLTEDLGGDGLKRENIGTLKATSGQVSGEALDGIVAPGLRDAWYNAPYLHDGSAPTLEAALKAHNNVSLTEDETRNLASYIRELGNGQ